MQLEKVERNIFFRVSRNLTFLVGVLAVITFVISIGEGWGYDKKGKMVLDATFNPNSAEGFSGLLAPVKVSGWGYIDERGNFVITPHFNDSQVGDFSEGFTWIVLNNKVGYIDKNGKIAIKPRFEKAWDFQEGLALVCKVGEGPGYCGYINKNGKYVIISQFADAMSFSEGLAAVKMNDQWGYIDKTGKFVITPRYTDVVGSFSEGLAKVSIGTKDQYGEVIHSWGYIDKTGNFVITPQFSNAGDFSEDFAGACNSNNKCGYIDKSGNNVIGYQYDKVADFSQGLARVAYTSSYGENQWGYIDKEGKIVIKLQFSDAGDFSSNGLARVCEGNQKCGYIDKTGRFVIGTSFNIKNANSFSDGIALVKVDGYGYIDRNGTFIIKPKFNGVSDFSEGLATITLGDKWGYIDKTGKLVIPPQFTNTSEFSEGLAAVDNGYIDKTGKFVIQPLFEIAKNFSEGLAAVRVGRKWGYIDKTGKFVIKPQIDIEPLFYGDSEEPEDFSEGLARVNTKFSGERGYIDRNGRMKLVLKHVWRAGDFHEGRALVEIVSGFAGSAYTWGYVDKRGRFVIKPVFTSADAFSDGFAGVCIGFNKCGYINKMGKFVVKPIFEEVGSFSNGLAPARIGGLWGYINKTGKFVIPPQFSWVGDFM